MTIVKYISAVLFILVCVAFAPVHHGWSNYDQNTVLDYTGKVQEFTFENPHASVKVKDKGKIWNVILAPVSRMNDRGVPNKKLTRGSSIRVVGYPHKEIKNEMRAERIFIAGTKYELR